MRKTMWMLAMLGCGESRPTHEPTSTDQAPMGEMGSGSSEGQAEADDRPSPGFDLGEVRFDLGPSNEPGPGCSKVDFLFVVDNSASMADEQAHLVASFPGFATAIEDTLGIDDIHVMVVDTDAAGAADECAFVCESMLAPECSYFDPATQTLQGGACDRFAPPSGCDHELGAGEAVGACGAPAEPRFLRGTEDLAARFGCLGLVGTDGSGFERPMDAMRRALGELPGCNAGFLRDDAILVVTIVGDEDDGPDPAEPLTSLGDPSAWKQALVQAKGGNEHAVVVLGLVGDAGLPGAICEPFDALDGTGAQACPHLVEFVRSFEYGVLGSVCAADYVPFFMDAIAPLGAACAGFTPPG